jgi:hypothetical protein
MRELDPRIHPSRKNPAKQMDCRVKPAMTVVATTISQPNFAADGRRSYGD